MKYIKTIEALSIKQYRPYHKEAIKANYKERYKEIFQKYEGDKNAFRIYIPLIKDNKKSETQLEVEKILLSLNYDISNYDYAWGKIKFPGSKNWSSIGKILNKYPDVLKKFAEDETRTLKGKNEDLEVCISRHPYDVVGSDTDRPWINCMTLFHYNRFKKTWFAKGQSIETLKHDVRQGSLTAYLIKKTDRNIQEPLANIGIKPYQNENDKNDIVLVPDNRMYGLRNLNFSITVFAWCDEVNGDKIGKYKIAKGLHMDNFKREKGMIGAEIKGREDIEEYNYEDPRSYFATKYLPKNEGFNFEYDKVKRGVSKNEYPRGKKERLLGLRQGMPVKWIDSDSQEEMTGYFYEYSATTYTARTQHNVSKVYNSDIFKNHYRTAYIPYDNKTFQLNELEIDANKYNL